MYFYLSYPISRKNRLFTLNWNFKKIVNPMGWHPIIKITVWLTMIRLSLKKLFRFNFCKVLGPQWIIVAKQLETSKTQGHLYGSQVKYMQGAWLGSCVVTHLIRTLWLNKVNQSISIKLIKTSLLRGDRPNPYTSKWSNKTITMLLL